MDAAKVQQLVRELLGELGEDPSRAELAGTPERVAETLRLLTSGYEATLPSLTRLPTRPGSGHEMVVLRDLGFFSLCEHHLLPFFGRCHVGYIPGAKIWDVEQVIEVVVHFSRRLQLQEKLTEQIADALCVALEPEGVGVLVEGRHLCMMMRGVEKQNSEVQTSSLRGSFHDAAIRRSFFAELLTEP